MTCALYARVSTTDQHCEMQLAELRRYTQARGWTAFAEYTDQASGSKQDRPELNRLLNDARARRFDTVLVWKLDRWGRSIQHSLTTIQELTELGIRFIAVTQAIDTDQSNPGARFLMHILTAVTEFERELNHERVAAGIKHAKENGVRFGRPKLVFDRDKIRQMHERGLSIRDICEKTGLKRATVGRVCKADHATLEK